jgi:hypothetical protein
MFAEKYVLSLSSSNLQDDEHHYHSDALAAAARQFRPALASFRC